MQNNTQSHMQDTIHTNLQIFIYTVLYTFQADLVDVFCAHFDLKWSCEQYWFTTSLWFLENGGSMGFGGGGVDPNITGQVRSNKYVKNKEGKIVEFCLLKHPGHYGRLTNNEYTWMPLL